MKVAALRPGAAKLPGDVVAGAVRCVSEPSAKAITHVPGGHLPAPPVAPGLRVLRGGQEGRPQLVVAVFSALRRRRDQGTARAGRPVRGGRPTAAASDQ